MNILIHFFTPAKITLEAYYQALAQADLGWHEGTNDPEPFIKYMLGIILKCYREFEERLIISEKSGKRSSSCDIVKTYVNGTIGTLRKEMLWKIARV